MHTRFLFLLILLLGFASGTKSLAGPIDDFDPTPYAVIRPASAVVIHDDGSATALSSVGFDGTGLSDPSPLRGAHSNDPNDMIAIPFDGDSPVSIRYDLGSQYNVNELWLWQYNGEGETDRGMSDFDILFRDEDGQIVGQLAAAEVERAIGFDLPASYFCPTAESVRFVELVIRDNYGDNTFVGLSDIAFAGRLRTISVPESSSMAVALVLGLLSVAAVRRRSDR